MSFFFVILHNNNSLGGLICSHETGWRSSCHGAISHSWVFSRGGDSPGRFWVRPLWPLHSRTLEISTRICFWHSDLLLLGQGRRLLLTGRFACSSFTARFCRIRELASAAIFPLSAGGSPQRLGYPPWPGLPEESERGSREESRPSVRRQSPEKFARETEQKLQSQQVT